MPPTISPNANQRPVALQEKSADTGPGHSAFTGALAAPVPAGVINPARGQCRHWSKGRLQPECCVANRGVAATAACFRFAESNQATR